MSDPSIPGPPKAPPAPPKAPQKTSKKTMVARGPLPPPPPVDPLAAPAPAPDSRSRAAAKTRVAPAATVRKAPQASPAFPMAPPAATPPAPAASASAPRPVPAERSATTYRLPKDPPADHRADRERQVGSHLAGAEGLVEAGTEGPRIRLAAGKPVPGTRYVLRRWLGEGGMGVVYEAEHMDIERHVALKILRFDLSQQAHMAQVFRDEARAASKIGSDYIVEIFDFGELPDGRLWFCMDLLDGTDLVPETETSSMDPARLIGLMRMCCKGLDRAHERGIVHRDIKPENILVVQERKHEVVKIVDFGISAMLAAGQSGGGTVAGTPHYMPPEQVLGQPFDGRCDMYALGATAYELLVGQAPFQSDDLEELLDMQVNAEPPPIGKVRTDIQIPDRLGAVIMKCLAKDPADRYANMRELEAALCEAQIHHGIQTPWDDLELPEVDEERRQWLLAHMPSPVVVVDRGKRRWLWPAVAAGSAALAGVAIFFALNQKPSEDELAQVEELTQQARAAGSRANWVYPSLTDTDAATSYVKVVALEELPGKLDAPGDERAEELRKEFSQTLTTLGDQFWELEDTRPIARDYYWQAALFDDTNEVAFERSGVTPGFLAQQREKALGKKFTESEIRAARQQVFLAQADSGVEIGADEQAMLFAMADDEGSVIQRSTMDRAMRAKGIKRPPSAGTGSDTGGDEGDAPEDEGGGAGAEGANDEGANEGGEDEGGDDPESLVLEEIADDRPSITSGRGRTKKKKVRRGSDDAELGKGERNPDKADELADQGLSALRAGRRSEASKLFNQAISYDNRSAKALMGLSDVYFDTGSSQKAVMYAERAVRAASKNSSYRLKLGDAYYKVLRYHDALEQYEKAKALGHSKAQSRIDKVKAKTG